MNRRTRSLLFSVVFLISMAAVFCAGYYRKSISMESGKFKLELSSDKGVSKSKAVVFDVQNEGFPKKTIQPDKISISTGHGSGVSNIGEQPVWLSVRLTGVNGKGRIASTDPIFDERSESCTKPLMPGEMLNVDINLDFPRKALANYIVSRGKIEFYDYKRNEKLGEVPLKIVNSKPGNSCCAINEPVAE